MNSGTTGNRFIVFMPRRKFHQWVFSLAGIYNISWGLYSAINPQWLFRRAHMPLPTYPEIFACLGMIIGLYGFLYLEVARVPEKGWLVAAMGFIGKILGPFGWFWLHMAGRWPSSTFVLILTNDIIWWIPFAIYLYDAWPSFISNLKGNTE